MAKNHADKYPSKKATKPPSKAGVIMFEDMPEGRKLLAAYNEGRFAKNGQFLVLPKGSIDEGETTLRAGLREFSEETGFPLIDIPERTIDGVAHQKIDGFLSEAQVQALERGETLHTITNPKFSGFEIVRFEPHEFTHTYHARSGSTHGMVMYGVEVKGLDAIAPYLKNAQGKTTKDCLDANKDIPRFATFLAWMKQGFIPADGDLPQIVLHDFAWFARKVNQHMPQGIEVAGEGKPNWDKTRANWQKFCKKMEADSDYKTLRHAFHAIKERMVTKGYVQGDNAALKFDEKDCPLFWYTEGGVIDYARAILAKTFADMEKTPDYARAFGGEGTKRADLHSGQKRALGQVAGYKDFIPRDVWRGACLDAGVSQKQVVHIMRGCGQEKTEPTPTRARA